MMNRRNNRDINNLTNEIIAATENAIEEICTIIEGEAVLNCPVDTSRLKQSITHEVTNENNKIKGQVGTNVEYAYFADRKKPYLTLAVDRNKSRANSIVERHLRGIR